LKSQRPTVVDLFAGAGGFSLGFQMGGFKVIGAVEIDKWASQTFAANHPDSVTVVQDIKSISDRRIARMFPGRKPDVLLGGPPCQGFSICRSGNGDSKDPRNSLFEEFIRAAKVLSPSIVIMENVPNIQKSKTQSGALVLDIIEQELRSLNYHVYSSILEATGYGIPQMRKRLFVIGSRMSLDRPFPIPMYYVEHQNQPELLPDSAPCPTLWDAISDLPELCAGEGTEEGSYTSEPLSEYQSILRNGSGRLFNHKAMNHTRRMVERFKSMSCGDSVSDVPKHLRPYRRNSNGKISGKVYDQNNRRMHADRPCHTIPASFYANFVHPHQHRNFTAREGARIQSFPDSYVFKGKPTVVSHKLLAREGRTEEKHLCQYGQIGNAVPPLLAKAIALNLLEQAFPNKKVQC